MALLEYLFLEKGITPCQFQAMPIGERAMIRAFVFDENKQRADAHRELAMKKR